jgi:hypothetical protein
LKPSIKYPFIFIISVTAFSCSSTKKVVTENQKVIEHSDKILDINKNDSLTKTNTSVYRHKKIDTTKTLVVTSPEKTATIIVNNTTEFLKNISNEKIHHNLIYGSLLEQFVNEKGNIDYKGIKKSRGKLNVYLKTLSENLPKKDWTKEDKLAYWMNAYNAFTIKLIIDNYPTKSIKNIKNAWSTRFFKLGKKWYNLSEIEHKILRKMNDPRIHFGINCASYSCPPLYNRAFTANNVNAELDNLARNFINNKQYNVISENTIQLSKIFQWYAKDFKTEGSLIDYLNKYSDLIIDKNAKKSFKKYDWNLNE